MTPDSTTSDLSGHRVLPVKFTSDSASSHHLFFKPHRVRDPCAEKPNLRTLLVSNVPPWATRDAVKSIFAPNGNVEGVHFQKTATSGPPPPQDGPESEARVGDGFKYAYVVFERPSSVKRAMTKMDLKQPRALYNEKRRVEVGLEKWRKEYNESLGLDVAALERAVEEGVAAYDAVREEERRRAERQAEEDEADDEGWVTVSRHTAKTKVAGGSAKAQARAKAREARKRKRKELDNFYRAQMKEKKLKRMGELREKFEKDKQRQLEMKMERKFRPK